MPENEDFDPEIIDSDSENVITTFALLSTFFSIYPSSGEQSALSAMRSVAALTMKARNSDSKAESLFHFLINLESSNSEAYLSLLGSLSGFSSLKNAVKSKLDESLLGDLSAEYSAVLLSSLIFGYTVALAELEFFWPYLKENQGDLFNGETPLSESNLLSVYASSSFIDLKFSLLNSGKPTDVILYILKFADVESLFLESPPILPNLMKDSEIQSYRISGKVNYFYGFDPSIVDCEQIEVGGVTGFRDYPCNKVSVKPRDLQFNQIITDGPYSSGGSSVVDAGIKLLTSIKDSRYDSSRLESVKILNEGSYFSSYNSGWVFDEFSGKRSVNLRGDVAFANNADSFKSFPDGAQNGQYHFLGSYTFTTGTGVGQIFKHSGFNPILLRLNDTDEQRIHSQLEVNLFDKQKRSGQLMAYAVSTDRDILSSFSDGDSYQYPLLSIANHTPSIPFIGINLEFSSKTFNKAPAAKFNFGSLYFVPATKINPGGSFTKATDFSFTGFNFTGDYFDLSTGSIKFNKEIKNTDNFNPESAVTNETNENGPVYPQPGEMLFQKALGFSNYKDCITGVEGVENGLHYGVEYKYILGLTPPEIEDEENKHVKSIGDAGVLKYVTGFGPAGEISPLLSKTVFGPLDSNTDQGLDGKDFNYKYLPGNYKTEELSYAYVPALNPARYYSGLFASERRQFLYPSAKKIHDKNKNRYFPSQVKLSFKVEEEYSKSANGSLSRYGGNVKKTIGELSDYWVDQDFSPPNLVIPGQFSNQTIWTYNPLTNKNLNPNYQYLTGSDVSITDGKLDAGNLTDYSFAPIDDTSNILNLSLPKTPLVSNVKKEYGFEIEMNYNLPIKSLSDFLDHREHSNKSFISTGDSEINIINGTGLYGWTEKINTDVNNGADPLFNTALDVNKNISGDSWNGFYLKSGTVVYGANPFREPSSDKILVQASDNSSNLRLFLRNLNLFPTFVNNDQDKSYGSAGQSFVEDSLSSSRRINNFTGSRIFEIDSDSILNSIPIESSSEEVLSFTKNISLNKLIEKDITRTGKLYYAPELVDQSVMLPEVSVKQYKQITDLYPQLNGYTFYSGVDAYSRMNSGYYIKYTESSNLKLTITSAEVKYDRFPASDELFEFYLTGKAAFSGELSYLTQEESSVITHGMRLTEVPDALDEFQKIGYFFDYCSEPIKSLLNVSDSPFPTKQLRRKSKLIFEKNKFVPTSKDSPGYYNRFHVKVVPEFVFFTNEGHILGEFGNDNLIYTPGGLICSSSYDYKETYENGDIRDIKKTDKVFEVKNSVRMYDSYFTNSLANSGYFIEHIKSDKIFFNSNAQSKTFYGPYGSFISDMVHGDDKNLSITLVSDRTSDLNDIRDSNKPTGFN